MIDFTNDYARVLIRERLIEAQRARLAELARSTRAADKGETSPVHRLLARLARVAPVRAHQPRPDGAGSARSFGQVR